MSKIHAKTAKGKNRKVFKRTNNRYDFLQIQKAMKIKNIAFDGLIPDKMEII